MADAVADAHARGFVHGGLSPGFGRDHAPRATRRFRRSSWRRSGGFAARTVARPGCTTTNRPKRRAGSRPTSGPTSIRWARSCTRCSRRGGRCIAARRRRARRNPNVPKELDAVVLKAVAPNPDEPLSERGGVGGASCARRSPCSTRAAWPVRKRNWRRAVVDERRPRGR